MTLQTDRRVYLDLDGVMADFDEGFPRIFGRDHRAMPEKEMWDIVTKNPSFFEQLEPMPGALDFFALTRPLAPIILTACPSSCYAEAAYGKRRWVRKDLSPTVTVLPVRGGISKPYFMHEPGDVLIDDWEKNTKVWTEAGGHAILHRDFDSTKRELFGYLGLALPEDAYAVA